MLFEAALLSLGTSAAKAVAHLWLQGDFITDVGDNLIEHMAGRIPSMSDRKRIARQFDAMADRIAEQLSPLIEAESGRLPVHEMEAAVAGVRDTLESTQALGLQALFERDFDPVRLEELLQQQPQARVRNDLAAGADLLFDRLLRESCNFIVELALAMPDFSHHALIEILRRETEIIDRVRETFERMPRITPSQQDDDEEFSLRYRRHIARQLDQLELFGITLQEKSRRYDLSIAYITLTAQTNYPNNPAVEAASNLIVDDPETSTDEDEGTHLDTFMRVDEALSQSRRHLIRGEAGSGKTTLLQWLAITLCREPIEGSLDFLSSSVPLFLQLRRYANAELPAPENFLDHVAKPIAGVMPDGWVHRRLENGEAAILIDGVDELPERQRPAARNWLRSLTETYPDCFFVVTTRPSAVAEDWLHGGNFSTAELLPMSLADTTNFIEHWYTAAARAVAHHNVEVETLKSYQGQLIRVIRDTPTLRSLATSPLLCAMLCALNRDRRTQLPRDRMELYRIVLESLLDRRDVEREIAGQEPFQIGLREKEGLLQDLAFMLMVNEQSDTSTTEAIERVDKRLQYMNNVSASGADVYRYLLIRSGLIREPVEGRVDFIHRTFQEYLGAARVVREGYLPMLVSRAHSDQWREAVILAAGHASRLGRDDLIERLLERGNEEPELRHRLHLLAVACLETAAEDISPSTVEAVNAALARALPPTNMTEAKAVASAGATAVPLLARYTNVAATTTAACVRALCLIGGSTALSALKNYQTDKRLTVIRELIRGWEYFNRDDYASEVLANSSLESGILRLNDAESLASAHRLGQLRRLLFTAPRSLASLGGVSNASLVHELEIGPSSSLENLDGLNNFTSLKELDLERARDIRELPSSLPPSLQNVSIRFCWRLSNLRSLGDAASLRQLIITSSPVPDLSFLSNSPIQHLDLWSVKPSAVSSWLETLDKLKILRISLSPQTEKENDPSWLSQQTSLRSITSSDLLNLLDLRAVSNLRNLAGVPAGLTALSLGDLQLLENANELGNLRNLRSLTLSSASALTDFSFLSTLSSLTNLNLSNSANFVDLRDINYQSTVRLHLRGTGVKDISPLAAMPKLVLVDLVGCPIENLEVLGTLPRKLHLQLGAEMRDRIDESLTRRHFISFRS
ncbi:NACHT domain-containing protein [Kineococcus sp. SYSU DK001]|uniref:NACHT domain-containing protein n=1 Tax=Kineococcus sp. SYSU DK001 TaxID=3383122 RepID=UPI003D7CFE17